MNRTTTTLAALAIAALALTGCATEADQTSAPASSQPATEAAEPSQAAPEPGTVPPEGVTQEEWDHHNEYAEQNPPTTESYPVDGDYGLILPSSGVGRLSLDAEGDPEHERLREAAGADPLTYAVVEVDNRNGYEVVDLDYGITAYDEAGQEYEWETMDKHYTDWQNIIPPGPDGYSSDLWDELMDASFDETRTVEPGQVAKVVLATDDELPAEFTTVNVGAGPFASAELFPAEDADEYAEYGFDLNFEVPGE